MKIGFDADGVLYDTEAFLLKYGVKHFREKYNMALVNPDGYGIKEMFNCTDEQEKEFWTKHGAKYLLTHKPRHNMAEVIQQLRKEGHEVHIITAKGRSLEKGIGQIVQLLFEIGLKIDGIEVDHIHYCSNKNSEQEKLDLCRELGIDVKIEDKKSNIESLKNVTNVLCMTTRDNQDYVDEKVRRVNNADEIYAQINKDSSLKLNRSNIFTKFKKLSREERENLTNEQLIEYYKDLREYYAALPFDNEKLDRKEQNFKVLAATFSAAFHMKYHPKVINQSAIPEENGLIFTSNHLSSKDILLILYALRNKPFHPLGKIELSEGFIGMLHDVVETVYVDRKDKNSRREAINEMSKLLINDRNMLIFPEGTHNKTGENLKSFDGVSAVYLSQTLNKPILPISVTDTYGKNEQPIIRFQDPYIVDEREELEDANEYLKEKMNELVIKNKHEIKMKRLNRFFKR